MAQQENNKRISAIVPAYNEAGRIEQVLSVLISYPDFDEVIVIDDGSNDDTSDIAARFGAQIARNHENIGKGRSIDRGIAMAKGDIIFCSDADIIGLTHSMIDEILLPVKEGRVDMFIGMQDRTIYSRRPILLFTPLLGGQRAFTRELWGRIPPEFKERFRIETALNFYAIHTGKSFQIIKEKKYGALEGFLRRLGMFSDIIAANWLLHMQPFSPLRLWRRLVRSFFVRRDNITEGK